MVLLPWAQEVPSSNLGAPTKISPNEFVGLCDSRFSRKIFFGVAEAGDLRV